MAQQVSLPATKLDTSSSIPGIHVVEGENSFLQFFPNFHTHAGVFTDMCVHIYSHTHKMNKCKIKRGARLSPIPQQQSTGDGC